MKYFIVAWELLKAMYHMAILVTLLVIAVPYGMIKLMFNSK